MPAHNTHLLGVLVVAGALHSTHSLAQRASGEGPMPASPAQAGALDFEAPVDGRPALPPGSQEAEGLADALRRAERLAGDMEVRAIRAVAPAFVQKLADGMRARVDSIGMMADDRTYGAGEAGLRRANADLDREAGAALAAGREAGGRY